MPRPTLLIQASTRPQRATASAASRSTCARSVTSATRATARGPAATAAAASASGPRATRTGTAPRAPRRRAVAAPIPALAPVMTTTRSRTAGTARRPAPPLPVDEREQRDDHRLLEGRDVQAQEEPQVEQDP